MKTLGVLLIIVGSIGVIWGGIAYVKDRDTTHPGLIHMTADARDRVSIPPVFAVSTLVVGGLLVLMSTRRGPQPTT